MPNHSEQSSLDELCSPGVSGEEDIGTQTCPHCDHAITVSVSTCPYCQEPLSETSTRNQPSPTDSRTRYHHAFFILVDAKNEFEAEAKAKAACDVHCHSGRSYDLAATTDAVQELINHIGPSDVDIPSIISVSDNSQTTERLIEWGIEREEHMDNTTMFWTDDGGALADGENPSEVAEKRGWLVTTLEKRTVSNNDTSPRKRAYNGRLRNPRR